MTATLRHQNPPPAPTGHQRLLPASLPGLDEHAREHGPLPLGRAADLISAVRDAGLTGRGGAGFPTGRKLAEVARGRRGRHRQRGRGEPASNRIGPC
jgi:hypothetical protein